MVTIQHLFETQRWKSKVAKRPRGRKNLHRQYLENRARYRRRQRDRRTEGRI